MVITGNNLSAIFLSAQKVESGIGKSTGIVAYSTTDSVLCGIIALIAIRRSNRDLVGSKRATWGLAIGTFNLVFTLALMWIDSRPSHTFARQSFG